MDTSSQRAKTLMQLPRASLAAALLSMAPAASIADSAIRDFVNGTPDAITRAMTRAGTALRSPIHAPPEAGPALGAALPEPGEVIVHDPVEQVLKGKNIADELTIDASAEKRDSLDENGPWLSDKGPSENARQLLAHITDSRAHGLNPERYDLDRLRSIATQLTTHERAPAPSGAFTNRDSLRASVRKGFEQAFRLLAADLGHGVVDPRDFQRRMFRDPPVIDVDDLLHQLGSGQIDVNMALQSLTPSHEGYRDLITVLRNLMTEQASGVGRTQVADSGDLRETNHHQDVLAIKHRLIETGELPLSTILTPLFDEELVTAVTAFQQRHGIVTSGEIDEPTRKALNMSVLEEIEAVVVNLERWRWLPRDLGERHLFMNLPSYRLQLENAGKTTLDMAVVIGAVEHPTPVFTRDMSYMEFNPTWTVPSSIAHRELLPKERRYPGWLKKRGFRYLKWVKGRFRQVPYRKVSRDDIGKRPFPYTLQQAGGPGNALGDLKFMMPNPYSIYLHDTQAKNLFQFNERAASHGCIRVSEPDRLARQLLQDDGYSQGMIKRLLKTKRTRRARLGHPIPTHIVYFTTWVDDAGLVQHRPDIYSHNPALRKALEDQDSLVGQYSEVVISDGFSAGLGLSL